jgi:hypothetical protein
MRSHEAICTSQKAGFSVRLTRLAACFQAPSAIASTSYKTPLSGGDFFSCLTTAHKTARQDEEERVIEIYIKGN